MHQPFNKPSRILSYWVIQAYDPSVDAFTEVFKSYGQNVANTKLAYFLKRGICAVVTRKSLPMI